MAIRTTTWKPDTCLCEVQYSWDDTVAENVRTHTPLVGKKCPAHAGAANLAAQQATLLEENTRKNRLLARLKTVQANLFDSNGAFTGTWSFNGSRVLRLSHPALLTANRTSLQTWADANLAAGRVIVG